MSRIPFSGIEVFLAIAREGSLRAAAASLGIGPPAVSQHLKSLESEMGVSLVSRTTRSLELTNAGRTLLEGIAPAYGEISRSIERARQVGGAKSGTLRLSLPWSAYKMVLAPCLAEFRSVYPEIRLELSFDEALVDIVRAGMHAGMRLGDRLAPGMVAVRLTPPLKAAYSASPFYLDRKGRPQTPGDLLFHDCIRYRFITTNRIAEWQFRQDDQIITVDPPACLVFDGFQSVVQAARQGHGIGWSLRGVVEDEYSGGTLEPVLEPFVTDHPPFYLYYPEQNRQLELLRILIDFLVAKRS